MRDAPKGWRTQASTCAEECTLQHPWDSSAHHTGDGSRSCRIADKVTHVLPPFSLICIASVTGVSAPVGAVYHPSFRL